MNRKQLVCGSAGIRYYIGTKPPLNHKQIDWPSYLVANRLGPNLFASDLMSDLGVNSHVLKSFVI